MIGDVVRKTLNGLELKTFMSGESWGGLGGGGFAMDINIGYSERPLDVEDNHACHKHFVAIERIIRARTYRESPKVQEGMRETRAKILECFPDLIYVKTVSNQYHLPDDVVGEMDPWFEITTKRGTFLVGWRKRVINLDWSGTNITSPGEELFADENVTKGPQFIHCYGYPKLMEYVSALMVAP